MPALCAVVQCSNTSNDKTINPNLIHHRFPTRNPTLSKVWLHFCRRQDTVNVHNARICSDHFQPSDYERDMEHELLGLPLRKKLKRDAVPSIFSLKASLKDNKPNKRAERLEKRQRRDVLNSLLGSSKFLFSFKLNILWIGKHVHCLWQMFPVLFQKKMQITMICMIAP